MRGCSLGAPELWLKPIIDRISLGIEVVNSSRITEPLVPGVALSPDTVTRGASCAPHLMLSSSNTLLVRSASPTAEAPGSPKPLNEMSRTLRKMFAWDTKEQSHGTTSDSGESQSHSLQAQDTRGAEHRLRAGQRFQGSLGAWMMVTSRAEQPEAQHRGWMWA